MYVSTFPAICLPVMAAYVLLEAKRTEAITFIALKATDSLHVNGKVDMATGQDGADSILHLGLAKTAMFLQAQYGSREGHGHPTGMMGSE